MIFDALIKENNVLKILDSIEKKKGYCHTEEAIGRLEDLEFELNQKLKEVQEWLNDY